MKMLKMVCLANERGSMTPEHIKRHIRTAKAHLEQCIDLLEEIEEMEFVLCDTRDLLVDADENLYEILTQEQDDAARD